MILWSDWSRMSQVVRSLKSPWRYEFTWMEIQKTKILFEKVLTAKILYVILNLCSLIFGIQLFCYFFIFERINPLGAFSLYKAFSITVLSKEWPEGYLWANFLQLFRQSLLTERRKKPTTNCSNKILFNLQIFKS